jgi:branched-chain amino acid transport system ATP-binding protein
MTEPGTMLEVSNLTVAYGKLPVVHDVSLAMRAGEFVSLLGRNGAGKSTTLHAISSLIPKQAGKVVFDGIDITQAAPRTIVQAGLVQVLEGHRVFKTLTVEDNLLIGTYAHDSKGDRTRLPDMYDLFPELAERRQQQASRLSGGQQQILAVAQAMIARPRLLILDEPSGGLAPVIVDRILDVAKSLCGQRVAVLLVEQLIEKALARSDRAYLMENGAIVHEGPAAGLADSDILREAVVGGRHHEARPG